MVMPLVPVDQRRGDVPAAVDGDRLGDGEPTEAAVVHGVDDASHRGLADRAGPGLARRGARARVDVVPDPRDPGTRRLGGRGWRHDGHRGGGERENDDGVAQPRHSHGRHHEGAPPRRPADTRGSVRESARQLEQPVVGLVLADRDPGALAGERADDDAELVGGGRELGGPLAELEPDEVALRAGTVPAGLAQPGAAPGPARRPARRPARAAPPRRRARRWPRPGRPRRRRTAATPRAARRRAAPAPRRTRPGTRPARRPWRRCGTARRWGARGRSRGRRPGRPSGRTRRRPRRRRPARRSGTAARNASSSVWVTAGPVGLLGVQTITQRVRGPIAATIASRSCRPSRGDRHRHRGRRGGRDRDRVGLERAPGVHHLVAGLAERRTAAGRSARPTRSPPPGRRPAPAAGPPARRTARCCPCRGSGSSRRRRGARPRPRRAAAGRGSRSSESLYDVIPGRTVGGLPAT